MRIWECMCGYDFICACMYVSVCMDMSVFVHACVCVCLSECVWLCKRMCVSVSVCVYVCAGQDLRNKKWFAIFWQSRRNCDTLWQSDSHLRIIIRNLFAFLHPIHKICLKKSRGPKNVFWWYHLNSDSQSAKSNLQY